MRAPGDAAFRLQACFSAGVVAVDRIDGTPTARIANARLDTVSREVLRSPDLAECVRLGRVRDHYICASLRCGVPQRAPWPCSSDRPGRAAAVSVESTGVLPADVLVCEALRVLSAKCERWLDAIRRYESDRGESAPDRAARHDGRADG